MQELAENTGNKVLQDVAESLLEEAKADSAKSVSSFVESTFQHEKYIGRGLSEMEGWSWRFGARLSIECEDGSTYARVYDSRKLLALVGEAKADQLREQALASIRQLKQDDAPHPDGVDLHDVVFCRNISVADVRRGAVCSRHRGRRCELEAFKGQVNVSRRLFSADGRIDFDILLESVQRSLDNLKAHETVGAKKSPVLFHGATSALLFHELLGHPLELDNYAMSKKWLNEIQTFRVNKQLEFYDDPTLVDGYGSYEYDDAGNRAEKRPLLVGGGLHVLGASADGMVSQRRQDYTLHTLVRASNAVIRKGRETVESLSAFQRGGLLHIYSIGAGRIDIRSGEFEYSAPEAVWIEKDGREHVLSNVLLKGRVSELIEMIDGIADDVQVANVTCGKRGQFVPLGAQGPSVRFSSINWIC